LGGVHGLVLTKSEPDLHCVETEGPCSTPENNPQERGNRSRCVMSPSIRGSHFALPSAGNQLIDETFITSPDEIADR
jgi:hypothetical protein